ncbi:hypothetical protein D3C78_1662700 [compost metagenome]
MWQFFTQGLEHMISADQPRLDHVDQDVQRAELHRQPTGEGVHERLAGAVGDQRWRIFAIGLAGGDEDDPALALRLGKMGRRVLGQPEQRLDVAAHQVIEGIVRHLGDQPRRRIGGAMHQDIQRT